MNAGCVKIINFPGRSTPGWGGGVELGSLDLQGRFADVDNEVTDEFFVCRPKDYRMRRTKWGTKVGCHLKTIVILWCLVVTCVANAKTDYREEAPASGEWKGQPPGTYIVRQTLKRGEPVEVGGEMYRREVIVGVNERQKPWFAIYKSDSPTGPWEYSYGVGGGSDYRGNPDAKLTQKGEEILVIGDRKVPCVVTRLELTDDTSIHVTETWTEPVSGMQMQVIRNSRPRDADAPPREFIHELKSINVEQQTINGLPCTVFIQQSTSSTNGVCDRTYRIAASPDVPGHRISSKGWGGANTFGPPATETRVISWGQDLEALAEYRKRSGADKGTLAEQKRIAFEQKLADAKSEDPKVRLAGMRQMTGTFPPEYRERVDAIIRSGLADEAIEIRRVAAEAAGDRRLAGSSARIVELYHADTQNAVVYIRTLGQLAEPEGLETLLMVARSNKGLIGDVGAGALANYSDDRATAALKERLASPDRHTRYSTVERLSRAKNPHAVEMLVQAVNDESDLVRASAIQGLMQKPDPRGLDAAIQALDDPDEMVRFNAVLAVGRIGEATGERRKAADALFPQTQMGRDPKTRTIAALGMAKLKAPRVVPFLEKMARRRIEERSVPIMIIPDSQMAMKALADMALPETLDILMELAQEPDHAKDAMKCLRESRSPVAARMAWDRYLKMPAPARDATQDTQPKSNERSGLIWIITQCADKSLRDEIEASIPAAPVDQRPELRGMVRRIDENSAKAAAEPVQ